jgi:acetylornithine deacetylase/succinyl-diaminopimelate desuccinylase-like protein
VGVPNPTIHKVNECVRLEDIEALHAIYLEALRRLLG